MNTIISPLIYIPIRQEGAHKSEQVSQLLFGEKATVVDDALEWYKIRTHFDNYEGWIEKRVVRASNKSIENQKKVAGFARLARINGDSMWLSTGCELSSELIDSQSTMVVTINPELNESSVSEIAMQFLGTPYLWGGRSFMGIDCSGFVQVVFKALEVNLDRDASQQINNGKTVQFASEAKTGDLAFFDNEEGIINHVGIVLEPRKIIHASGSVRIDKIDQQGIFNEEVGTYTHKLRVIKRIL